MLRTLLSIEISASKETFNKVPINLEISQAFTDLWFRFYGTEVCSYLKQCFWSFNSTSY